MRQFFARHGLVDTVPEANLKLEADKRTAVSQTDRAVFPFQLGRSRGDFRTRRTERSSDQLKRLAESSLPSRAITLIRNGVSSLKWAIQTIEQVPPSERPGFKEEIEEVTEIIQSPNYEDNDLFTLTGKLVEDLLTFDAGVIEYVERPEFNPKNDVLGMFTVPGHTVVKNVNWNGNPQSHRWTQVVGNTSIPFRDDQIEYIMQRPRTFSPFGYSQLETAVEVMESWLGLSSYQRDVTSNAYPAFMLYLGDNAGEEQVDRLRAFWEMELQGRGRPGMWGNTGKPEVFSLKPTGDDGLYTRYQEGLVRTLAFCFGLKPQDFGLERDVNRSTAAVAQVASVEEARRPIAMLIANKINCKVIPRIAAILKKPRINQLSFSWLGIDPRQQKIDSELHNVYLNHDVLSIDDVRHDLGKAPLPGKLGQFPPSVLKGIARKFPEVLARAISGEVVGDEELEEVAQLTALSK